MRFRRFSPFDRGHPMRDSQYVPAPVNPCPRSHNSIDTQLRDAAGSLIKENL